MADEFGGRHVVVTGGTGALGTAVVARLVSGGARVTVPVFDEGELERFNADASGVGESEHVRTVVGVDLAEGAQVSRFYGDAVGGFGDLWGSVHLAGGFHFGAIADAGAEVIEKQLRMNAVSCYLCCREAVLKMREAGTGGRIVNCAARPAERPEDGASMVAYTASKAAVAAMTRALGAEVAGEGIWVNAIAPSIIDTAANREAMPDADHEKWPKPAELAETVAFLVGPGNVVTRGGVVPVYGGS